MTPPTYGLDIVTEHTDLRMCPCTETMHHRCRHGLDSLGRGEDWGGGDDTMGDDTRGG